MNNRTLIQLENEYYVINDDKINIGDWFYCSDRINYAHIFKCIGLTDDTYLQVSNQNTKEFGTYYDPDQEANEYPYGDWALCYSYKIIASTNKLLNDVELLNFQKADNYNY